MGFGKANASKSEMEEFKTFLKANNWKGKHVHRQMKKYAALVRCMGGSLNKTYSELARAWKREDGAYWIRDRNAERTIREYGGEEQRTAAWHAVRSTMITASEVGNVIEGTPSQRHEVLMRKVSPVSTGDSGHTLFTHPLVWGTKLEPVAKRIFERDTVCEVRDVSCVKHRRVPFLGASPDGIILSPANRERHHALVEFKCPRSRKPGDEIPRGYYHQMQLQMECTGIDECEFVQFVFKHVFYSEWKDFKGDKTIFVQYDDGRIEEWNQSPGPVEDGELQYVILTEVHRDLVERDPKWLETHLPVLDQFWKEVCAHREANTVPSKPGILKLEL